MRMEFNTTKCSRTVRHNKYERNRGETTRWWYKLFYLLESEAALPPDKRLDVVNDIFPEKLLNRILSILSFVRTCKQQASEHGNGAQNPHFQKTSSFLDLESNLENGRKEIGPHNPYTRFFRRRPDRAAIWHTLPPLSLEEMNLSQKAETITTAIAVDFVEWMESISDEDSPTSLTVPLVLKMFEIGFDTHAARSLQTRVKEMASVPDGVAILKGIPDNIGSKNGSMVLQLVLPSNNNVENGNYLTNTSIDEILGGTNNKRRSVGSQQEVYSTIGTESYVNQAFTNDLAEYNRSFDPSPVSEVSSSDQTKPRSVEQKKLIFRKHLTNILSSMYALFIVTLGLVIYISDVLLTNSPLAENFSLYLVFVDFIFILYLIVDISLYVKRRNRYNDLLQKNVSQGIELKESPTGDYHLSIQLPEAIKAVKQLDHHYCFSKDRHSANFYLKIGAAGFCVGHLIHSGLLLGYQILFLTSDGDAFYECASVESLILDILYPIYSFLLLYFIFKYSNIIINRQIPLVRFGIMHCLSSSLCFWIWTILRETVESLSNHHYEEHTNEETSTTSEILFFTGQPVALPLTSYNKRGAKLLKAYLNASLHQFVGECENDAGMSTIYRNYSPYLYPFTVEYSILVVGVLFVIWQNIGKCKVKEETSSTRQCDSPVENNDNLESNIVIHADCHSANKGLFAGIVIMVLTVVSVILFLIAVNDSRYEEEAIILNVTTSLIITILMTITSVFAYRQLTKLDINNDHVSPLDDLLLFICIPAFFLNGILTIIPAIEHGSLTSIFVIIVEVIQVLVQTPLIIDGLRRSSNSKELRRKKPGRELLTFLIVCNVAVWIMQTFEVKSHSLQDNRHQFYGEEMWTIVGHLCVPLMMFYRFHSSVCIVDIWKCAYESPKH